MLDWTNIIIAVVGALAGGGIVRLFTIKQARKKGDVEAMQGTIAAMQSVIESLRSENERKDVIIQETAKAREGHIKKYEQKCEEAATSKQMLCIHMGCALRDPILGQGENWFEAHKDNISLSADFTPFNVLMKRYGKKRRFEDAEDNKSQESDGIATE